MKAIRTIRTSEGGCARTWDGITTLDGLARDLIDLHARADGIKDHWTHAAFILRHAVGAIEVDLERLLWKAKDNEST